MRTSPVQELKALGQSLWIDNIRRQLVTSGELARLREEGVSGVTSNPTIFDKAVSGSTDYTEALVRKVGAGYDAEHILWELMLEDIRAAADVFRPVYDETVGADGYVSIEVSPRLAMEPHPPRVAHCAVSGLPTSGTPQELMEAAGISAARIAAAARELVKS